MAYLTKWDYHRGPSNQHSESVHIKLDGKEKQQINVYYCPLKKSVSVSVYYMNRPRAKRDERLADDITEGNELIQLITEHCRKALGLNAVMEE